MPISQEEKWGKFIELAFATKGISVSKIEDDKIVFRADKEVLMRVSNLLSDPEAHRKAAPRLESNNVNNNSSLNLSSNDTANNKQIEALKKILNSTPELIFSTLFDAEFLSSSHFNDIPFINDKETRSASKVFSYKSIPTANKNMGMIEELQSCLSNIKNITEIIKGVKQPFSEPEDAVEDHAKEILKAERLDDHRIKVTFNYGELQRELQSIMDVDHITKPIISTIEDGLYSISKLQLLGHLLPIFGIDENVGAIIEAEGVGGLREGALFSAQFNTPLSQNEDIPNVILAIDTSRSMKNSLPAFKVELKNIVNIITLNHPQWKLTLLPFSKDVEEFKFLSSYSSNDIKEKIDSLHTNSGTNLNGAIFRGLEDAKATLSSHPHTTLLVFTDGADTEKEISLEIIHNCAQSIRDQSSNFAMYTIGLGEGKYFNKDFFDKMANDNGFNHIGLKNIDELSNLHQYLQNLNADKFVLSFIIDELHKFKTQVAQNDIALLQQPVTDEVQILHNNNTFHIESPQETNHPMIPLLLVGEIGEISDNIAGLELQHI